MLLQYALKFRPPSPRSPSPPAALLLSNKWLMSTGGFKNQRLPLSLTCCHMIATFLTMSGLIAAGMARPQALSDARQGRHVLMLASVTGASIVLGIMCLSYIALSLEQAVGATTPFFTALFAYGVFGKHESKQVYISLCVLVAGTLYASQVGRAGWCTCC